MKRLIPMLIALLAIGLQSQLRAESKELVVFDKAHANGRGVADPKKEQNTAAVAESAAKDNGPAIHFHLEGAKWFGGIWNWHAWYPADAGENVSEFKTLQFQLKGKLEGEPCGLTIALGSAGGGVTGAVPLSSESLKNWSDGEWHLVKIPLDKLLAANVPATAKPFDKTKVSQFQIGSWSGTERKVDLWISDVKFSAEE